MTATNLIRVLWLGVAATLPFFAAGFVRLEIAGLGYIAIPMLIFGTIIAVGLVMMLMQDPALARPVVRPAYRGLLVCVYLFFLWHMVSMMASTSLPAAWREVVKLALAGLCFWATLVLFPRDRRFADRFFVIALWSSTLVLSYLMYYYAIVYKVTYLGTNLTDATKAGRNQLSWYLSIIVLYALFWFVARRRTLVGFLPVMVLIMAVVYVSSRGAWISIAGGLAYLVVALWMRGSKLASLKLLLFVTAGSAVMVAATLWAISLYVNIDEIGRRFVSIFRPEDIPELRSYEIRLGAVAEAWRGFETSPIVGVGLANTTEFVERLTHNDYMTVLLELGMVGAGLFLLILAIVAWTVGQGARRPRESDDWLAMATRAALGTLLVSLVFINTYTSVHFWFFLAMLVVGAEITSADLDASGSRRTVAATPDGASCAVSPAS